MIKTRLSLLIAALWVGSLWTIGYFVAPTLFATLADRSLAGSIAGALFRIEAWLSIVCGIALLGLQYKSTNNSSASRLRRLLVIGMLLCTLIGYFGLQPFMAELREAAGSGGVMESEARTRFAILHGASSAFYLLQSLLGAMLLWKLSDAKANVG